MSNYLPGSCPAESTPDVGDLDLTVVIPCLNEACTIGRCVDKALRGLHRLGVAGEVLVADNGSTDGSPTIARVHGARVIHVTCLGYGNALRAGIAEARGRFVIMGDADDSYDFEHISPFIERLREGYDLVMGNRFRGGIKPGAMPWLHRYVGNPLLTNLLNLFYRTPIRDAHCGLRAFRKDSYLRLDLRTQGMEFASEMVVRARLLGQSMTEVPIVLHRDGRNRPPHLRSFRDGWRHLRFLLLLCPMWLYMIPAGWLMAVGLGLMAWLTPGPTAVAGVGIGIHTMLLGSLCLVLGYQTLWLWAYAKVFGWRSGILPPETFSLKIFEHLNLERGLAAGALLLLTGLGIGVRLLLTWYGKNLGPLDVSSTMPQAIWCMTTMTLGAQTIYGSFFMSMLGMAEVSCSKS